MGLGADPAAASIRELAVAGSATDQQRVESAILTNQKMVFVWEDQSGPDSEVRFRFFTPATSQFSAVMTANAVSGGDQTDPVVTALADGGFAIAFASRPVGGDYDVFFRRFTNAGTPLDATDVAVNITTAGHQQHPALTRLSNSNLVIAFSGPGKDGQDLFFRRFAPDGTALDATEMPLNESGTDAVLAGDQARVRLSAFDAGEWVATFEDRATGNLYGVRLTGDGVLIPDPQGTATEFYFLLNGALPHDQFGQSVAGFGMQQCAVAFNSDTDGTAAGRRVRLRFFDSTGPASGDVAIGDAALRSQDPDVALISPTQLAVAWKSQELLGTNPVWSVYAQVFDLTGTPESAPLFLHADQSLDRGRPRVTPWANGGFVVSWETGAAGGGVAARTVAPLNVAPGVLSVALLGTPGAPQYRVMFAGFAGECYQLEAADVLGNWAAVLTTNAPAGTFHFDDPTGPISPHRYFRVKRKLSAL